MNSETLKKIVELQLGKKRVNMEDRFFEDLGAESVDMVNLMVTIEEKTGLFIPEETIPELKTIQNLLDYINSNQD